MNLLSDNSTDTHTIATSTAFRLPKALLQTVDKWCDEHDITRSQFFRHCITDRVKSLGLVTVAMEPKQDDQPQWSPELYERLQRKR